MDKAQELALETTYRRLLELSKNENVLIEDRLTCAFTAGCIKPGLSMENSEVIDNIMFNIMQGQKIISKYQELAA